MTKCGCGPTLSGIPLGGIGAGSVEIRADGALHEWQIFNNPPWCGTNEFMSAERPPLRPQDSKFAIRIKSPTRAPVVRLLRAMFEDEISLAYLAPHVRPVANIAYQAQFPCADLTYTDPALPVALALRAWSPFIPGDVKHSAMPVACFTFDVENRSDEEIEVSLVGLVTNPMQVVEGARPRNSAVLSDERATVLLEADGVPAAHPMARGGMALTVLGRGASVDVCGDGGGRWGGNLLGFWGGFRDAGRLSNQLQSPESHWIDSQAAAALSQFQIYAQMPVHWRGMVESGLVRDPRELERRLADDPIRLRDDLVRRWNLILELSLSDEALRSYQAALTADPALADDPERLKELLESLSAVNLFARAPRPEPPRGALCRTLTLSPGASEQVTFLLTWYFPNHLALRGADDLGHAYENWFTDASDVAGYVAERLEDLRTRTDAFRQALYGGTLPDWLADAVNAQLTTFFKSSFYVRDGRFGIWEGLGCCGLQTLDVTYYGSFPIVVLFPELEKAQMRMTAAFQLTRESPRYEEYFLAFPRNKAAFQERLAADPSLATDRARRLEVYREIAAQTGYDAVGRIPHFFPGSFATVDAYHMIDLMPKFALLVYRDYVWTGDREYLEEMWPHVRAAIDHNIGQDEQRVGLPYHYGNEATDIPISSQTYDVWDFLGYSAYVCSIWLASLRAAEAMARQVGDEEYAAKMAALFARAQVKMEELLWNGEYYDLWNDPLRGQRNEYCMADQLSGEWYVNALALAEILPADHIRSALAAVNRYNRLPERGLVNGVLPEGKQATWAEAVFGLPRNLQSDTPWTGTEYAVASLFIQEGLVEEGLGIARDVYDRHQRLGLTWNHYECGSHYYRAMAIWAVLQSLQGLQWDAVAGRLTLAPALDGQKHRSLVAVPGGWGVFSMRAVKRGEAAKQVVELGWRSGTLTLREWRVGLSPEWAGRRAAATVDGRRVESECRRADRWVSILFADSLILEKGQTLRVELT